MNKDKLKRFLNIIKISALIIILIVSVLQRIRYYDSPKDTEFVFSIPDSGKNSVNMGKDTGIIKTYDFKYFDDIWHSAFFIGRSIR